MNKFFSVNQSRQTLRLENLLGRSMYEYWRRTWRDTRYADTPTENFCHYGRIILFYGPYLWFVNAQLASHWALRLPFVVAYVAAAFIAVMTVMYGEAIWAEPAMSAMYATVVYVVLETGLVVGAYFLEESREDEGELITEGQWQEYLVLIPILILISPLLLVALVFSRLVFHGLFDFLVPVVSACGRAWKKLGVGDHLERWWWDFDIWLYHRFGTSPGRQGLLIVLTAFLAFFGWAVILPYGIYLAYRLACRFGYNARFSQWLDERLQPDPEEEAAARRSREERLQKRRHAQVQEVKSPGRLHRWFSFFWLWLVSQKRRICPLIDTSAYDRKREAEWEAEHPVPWNEWN